MRNSLLSVLVAVVAGCSEDVLTGAHAEFQATLTFPGAAAELTQTIDARIRPEVAQITRACGQLVVTSSSVGVVSFAGGEAAAPFTLTATLIDGATEAPLFEWKGTLEQNGRQSTFDRAEVGYSSAAGTALAAILKRADPTYTVRYRFSAPSAPSTTTVRVVQYLEFAVDAAECSAQ